MSHLKRALTAIVVSGAASLPVAPLHAEGASYEMRAYTNQPGGPELMAGDYDAAIEAATVRAWIPDGTSRLGISTNLCVAYTIERQFAEAEAACAKALDLAGSLERTRTLGARVREETAKALINRGVLRAVASDPAGAASDFRRALSVRAEAEVAASNLAYLDASPSLNPAVADAGN